MKLCMKTSWKSMQGHRLIWTTLLITITVYRRMDQVIMRWNQFGTRIKRGMTPEQDRAIPLAFWPKASGLPSDGKFRNKSQEINPTLISQVRDLHEVCMGWNVNGLNWTDLQVIFSLSRHNYHINDAQIEKLYSSDVDGDIEFIFCWTMMLVLKSNFRWVKLSDCPIFV